MVGWHAAYIQASNVTDVPVIQSPAASSPTTTAPTRPRVLPPSPQLNLSTCVAALERTTRLMGLLLQERLPR